MRALLILLVLGALGYGVYRYTRPGGASPSGPPPVRGGPPAPGGDADAPAPKPPLEKPTHEDLKQLLAQGEEKLSKDEHEGIEILSRVLAADPRGETGRRAAGLLAPVASRKGLTRLELTARWRLGNLDAAGWKHLEDLNAPLFSVQHLSKDPESRFYVVAAGDSLERIAKAHGTTVSLLQRLNARREDNTVIHPGDRLKVLPTRNLVSVEVAKSELACYLLYAGCLLRKYRVGIGQGDLTPEGDFRIDSRLVNPDWWKDGKMIPSGDPENILGTRWLGFAKPFDKFAIHGTTKPETIGQKASNGCVRLANVDVEELFAFCLPGTLVRIVP